MPDMAMCDDVGCPSRWTCYRYQATPMERQSYGSFGRKQDERKCDYYWPTRDDRSAQARTEGEGE